MTELILKQFLPRDAAPGSSAYRSAVGSISGGVGIFCNVLLFAMKLAVGMLSGSVSITADAMNNLSDAASSVVTFVGFRLAERPADEDHPYGHARYEYLSGLAVAGMILVIGFELAKGSLEKILSPAPVEFSVPMALVLVGSIAVKLWLSLFNSGLSKRIGSAALEATAADSRNDCVATGAVLLAAVVETAFGIAVDGWIGMAVAGFILFSGVNMAKETISPLLGENADPELRTAITETLIAHPLVLGYHDLMVHDYGPDQRFASVHVEMDFREDPLVCHEIIDNLERECMRAHNVHLVIHYDPVVVGDPELDAQRQRVLDILHGVDGRITIHDFRMVKSGGHTNLIFDVVLPHDLEEQKKAIRQELERALNENSAVTYYCVITFDLGVFN